MSGTEKPSSRLRDLLFLAVTAILVVQSCVFVRQNNSILEMQRAILDALRGGGIAPRAPAGERSGRALGAPPPSVPPAADRIRAILAKAAAFEPAIGTRGGTFTYAVASGPKTFNLPLNRESSTSDVLRTVFDLLFMVDGRTGEPAPWMAESCEMAPDRRSLVLKLRDGLLWSDGEPITIDDLLFTFEKIYYNPAVDLGAGEHYYFFIPEPETGKIRREKIRFEKLDRLTARLRLPGPRATILYDLLTPIYPKHVLERFVDAGTFNQAWAVNTDPKEIVGSGAFTLASHVPGERAVVERNPRYWRRDAAGNPLPYLDRIVFEVVPNHGTRVLKFESGEIDFLEMQGTDYAELKSRESGAGFTVHRIGPDLSISLLSFNMNDGVNPETGKPWVAPHRLAWFRDRTFRRAIAHALDKEGIVRNLFDGLAYPLDGPVSPLETDVFDPDLPKYPYDLARAGALLDSIGLSDRDGDRWREDGSGNPVEFTASTYAEAPKGREILEYLREDLEKIGVRMRVRLLEYNSSVDVQTRTRDWEVFYSKWLSGWDPTSLKGLWRSNEPFHVWDIDNPDPPAWQRRVDEILKEAEEEFDPAERKRLWREFQRIAAEELPVVHVVVPEKLWAISSRFENFSPSPHLDPRYWWRMDALFEKKSPR